VPRVGGCSCLEPAAVVSRARRFRRRGRRGLRWRYRGYSPGEVPAKAWPCCAGPKAAASGRRTTAGNITNGVSPATSTTTGGRRCGRHGLILFIVYDDDGVHRRQCSLDWGDSDERERNMERITPGIDFLPFACRISFDVSSNSSQNRSVFFSESLSFLLRIAQMMRAC
jgi:hypothetical protein